MTTRAPLSLLIMIVRPNYFRKETRIEGCWFENLLSRRRIVEDCNIFNKLELQLLAGCVFTCNRSMLKLVSTLHVTSPKMADMVEMLQGSMWSLPVCCTSPGPPLYSTFSWSRFGMRQPRQLGQCWGWGGVNVHMLKIKTVHKSGFIHLFTDLAQVSWILVFVDAESEGHIWWCPAPGRWHLLNHWQGLFWLE